MVTCAACSSTLSSRTCRGRGNGDLLWLGLADEAERSWPRRSTWTSTWRAPAASPSESSCRRLSANEPRLGRARSSRRQSLSSAANRTSSGPGAQRSISSGNSESTSRAVRGASPLLGLGLPAVAGGGRAVAGDVADSLWRPASLHHRCGARASVQPRRPPPSVRRSVEPSGIGWLEPPAERRAISPYQSGRPPRPRT